MAATRGRAISNMGWHLFAGLSGGVSEIPRPATVDVEGVSPVSEVVLMDPILMARAYAGPIRELLESQERYEKRQRE